MRTTSHNHTALPTLPIPKSLLPTCILTDCAATSPCPPSHARNASARAVHRSACPSGECAARYVICPPGLDTRFTKCKSSRIARLTGIRTNFRSNASRNF